MEENKSPKQILQEIQLPLSQEDYLSLRKLKFSGYITNSDMSEKLLYAYNDLVRSIAEEEARQMRDNGSLGAFD